MERHALSLYYTFILSLKITQFCLQNIFMCYDSQNKQRSFPLAGFCVVDREFLNTEFQTGKGFVYMCLETWLGYDADTVFIAADVF